MDKIYIMIGKAFVLTVATFIFCAGVLIFSEIRNQAEGSFGYAVLAWAIVIASLYIYIYIWNRIGRHP